MSNGKDFPTTFTPSGSTLLDLALGGGWAGRRISNVVGDRSTGKTLLVIEGMINYRQVYPSALLRYGEAEAAFEDGYAEQLGFPGDVERPDKPLETVEDFYNDLEAFLKRPGPKFYALDSLDALSDIEEKKRKITEDTYGVGKAKAMSELFRRLVQPIGAANCHLMIVSQVRENIGVMFGESYTRSGGKALDFYASQILWLANTGPVTRTVKGSERAIGVGVKGKVKKCKVGNPFREAEFDILFGYGVDDELSMIDWLGTIKALSEADAKKTKEAVKDAREARDGKTLFRMRAELVAKCKREWDIIEKALAPRIKKYGIESLANEPVVPAAPLPTRS